jgi:hypothetical protein
MRRHRPGGVEAEIRITPTSSTVRARRDQRRAA